MTEFKRLFELLLDLGEAILKQPFMSSISLSDFPEAITKSECLQLLQHTNASWELFA